MSTVGELLGVPVTEDGRCVGYLIDLRLRVVDDELRVAGLLMSRRRHSSFLGYERAEATGPWLLQRWFACWQRGTCLIDWDDVLEFDGKCVRVRPGFHRHSARLPDTRDDDGPPDVE